MGHRVDDEFVEFIALKSQKHVYRVLRVDRVIALRRVVGSKKSFSGLLGYWVFRVIEFIAFIGSKALIGCRVIGFIGFEESERCAQG